MQSLNTILSFLCRIRMVWDPVTGEVVSTTKHIKYQQKKRQQQAPSESSQEGTATTSRMLQCHFVLDLSCRILVILARVSYANLCAGVSIAAAPQAAPVEQKRPGADATYEVCSAWITAFAHLMPQMHFDCSI